MEQIILNNYNNYQSLTEFFQTKHISKILVVCDSAFRFLGNIRLYIENLFVNLNIETVFFSDFHAVSAFCNAGFDLFGGGKSLSGSAQRRREQKEAETKRRRQENVLRKTEEQIEALEETIAALEAEMALPENATDPDRLMELDGKAAAAKKALDL